jgi:hypothetical protein
MNGWRRRRVWAEDKGWEGWKGGAQRNRESGRLKYNEKSQERWRNGI